MKIRFSNFITILAKFYYVRKRKKSNYFIIQTVARLWFLTLQQQRFSIAVNKTNNEKKTTKKTIDLQKQMKMNNRL